MYIKTIKLFLELSKGYRALWSLAFFGALVFFISVDVVSPYVLSRFLNRLADIQNADFAVFRNFALLWAGLHLFQTVFGRVNMIAWIKAGTGIRQNIDTKVFSRVMNQSTSFFNDNFIGSLVSKFNRFDRSFDTIQLSFMMDVSSLLVQVIFPFAILLTFAPVIAIIFLVWVVIFSSSVAYLHKLKTKHTQAVARQDSKITGLFTDVITNALPVKLFSSGKLEQVSFTEQSQIRKKLRRKNYYYNDAIRVFKIVIVAILEIAVFYFMFTAAKAGQIDVGQIILIELYVGQMITSTWNIGKLVEKVEEAFADAAEMTELYLQTPSILDPENPEKLVVKDGNIEFSDMNFSYHEETSDQDILFEDFKLSIPAGQKVGLVGPSGGGKTTLTKLILRLMDINSGSIEIDGQNITAISQDDLRSSISYVPQEPLLFHRSIYENIAYGDPKATEKEVLKAAKLAHVDEFVEKLPEGYDTLVGERGVKLSGGQKQRVAIARAMLKKSPVLLLDEATSALDSNSEKLITSALDDLMKNRTTLVIAHRLSTIRKLDRILVLDNGEIVADGTHDELLKQDGLYKQLWSHQSGDFLED